MYFVGVSKAILKCWWYIFEELVRSLQQGIRLELWAQYSGPNMLTLYQNGEGRLHEKYTASVVIPWAVTDVFFFVGPVL